MNKSLVIVACLMLTGCKTYQNVAPQLDSAIKSYEIAKGIEIKIIDEEISAQKIIIDEIFNSLEDASITSLRQMLVSGWSISEGDFQAAKHDTLWKAWLGSASPAGSVVLQNERMRIRGALNDEFVWADGVTKTPVWTLFSRNIEFNSLANAPSGDDLAKLDMEYAAWKVIFLTDVLQESPIHQKITHAHTMIVKSLSLQRSQRISRTNLVYEDLITLATLARVQATALTDNAGFINIANKISETATRLLGHAGKDNSAITIP